MIKKNMLFIFVLFLFFTFPITAATEDKQTDQENLTMPDEYEGVYLEINKTQNTLKIYLNGYVVKRFPVATGKNNLLTPEGKFKIITKVKNPWYLPKNIQGGDKKNPLGTRWLGLNVPGTGGYKYGIHGTSNPYSIGHHVSLGCIRMHNKDIEWMYRHIPLGTPVIIKSDMK